MGDRIEARLKSGRMKEREIKTLMLKNDPELRTHGFGKVIRQIDELEEECGVAYEHKRYPMVPDLYWVSFEQKILHIFEIEVTHPMKEDKVSHYWSMQDLLIGEGWEMRLFTIDRYGDLREFDLALQGLASFAQQVRESM